MLLVACTGKGTAFQTPQPNGHAYDSTLAASRWCARFILVSSICLGFSQKLTDVDRIRQVKIRGTHYSNDFASFLDLPRNYASGDE